MSIRGRITNVLRYAKKRWKCVWFRLAVYAAVLCALITIAGSTMLRMPGSSYQGSSPPLSKSQKELEHRLKKHVQTLAGDIGERNLSNPKNLQRSLKYITGAFEDMEYSPKLREYKVQGTSVANLEVALTGQRFPEEIIVIGAHYDTGTTPGADDNASAVAALLELARWFHGKKPDRTLRFVAFVNEEPPFYRKEGEMGSWVYAKRARTRNDQIQAMLSLEMLGYYTEEKGSQKYPFPLSLCYPSTGNFVAFIGNFSNRGLVRHTLRVFRDNATIPSEGAALPNWFSGVGWSDHWSFWQEDYPAFMVTDTAPFRNPNYHRSSDTPQTLNYEKMTHVVEGLKHVVSALVEQEG